MRLRKMLLFAAAALMGAAAVALPAIAGSETTPTIEALNTPSGLYSQESHYWSPTQATVAAGASVTFANKGEVNHGVEWRSGPETPSCSSGVPVGTSAAASGTKWSGTCTFAKPGTYTFYCTVHGPEMTGTITVDSDGTTTTTMGSTTAAPPPLPTPPAGPQPTGSPLVGSVSAALELAARQGGQSVRGSLALSAAGSGGRLAVRLLATRASLATAGRQRQVQVGVLLRPALRAGIVSFNVPLDARARHALRARRRLALSVRIMLTPPSGAAVTIVRRVVLLRR